MKRTYLVFALSPMLLALSVAAGSCSAGKSDATKKAVTTYDPNGEEGDGGSGSTSSHETPDASALMRDAAFDPLRRVKTTAEALQVLITAYDVQTKEGEVGKIEGSTPPMKAFAADVVEEGKAGKARIRQVAANKRVTPANSMLADQIKFESTASLSHLQNVFPNMFNTSWCSRQGEAADALIRTIDQDLAPIMDEDEDLKAALATTRDQAEKRRSRADAVKGGLGDVGNADGMFPEPEDPEPEPQTPPPAADDAGAAE